jgi:hypothetical protein
VHVGDDAEADDGAGGGLAADGVGREHATARPRGGGEDEGAVDEKGPPRQTGGHRHWSVVAAEESSKLEARSSKFESLTSDF